MADFVQKTVNKSAVRDLSVPIADVTSFNNLIEMVIDDNPFGCVAYTDREGEEVPADRPQPRTLHREGELRRRERQAGRDRLAPVPHDRRVRGERRGSPCKCGLATAMGGTAVRDFGRESYYAQLKCHDPTGDDYYVTFTRKTVRISSYQDDAIKEKIETWADLVPALE
jgi:hypothetical protein